MENSNTLPEKAAVLPKERWLLLGVLALGVLFDFAWNGRSFLFGALGLLYLALFYLLNWNRKNPLALGEGETAPLYRNKTATALAFAAIAMCCLFMIRELWYSGYEDASLLTGMSYLTIPALILIHMAFSVREIPVGREWTAAGACLAGFFVKPFTAIPRFFVAAGSLIRGGKGKGRGVLIGLVAGIPLLALVLWLLSGADAMMGRLMAGLFQNARLGETVGRCIFIFVVAVLFYSFYWNAAWGKQSPLPAPVKRDWPPAAFAVMLSLLLAAYALFAYVQFTYLFGGRLPAGMTYSAYAREGFSQLVMVSVINFALLGVALGKAERSPVLTVLTALMLVANVLLLASAAMRLLLYIGAYGLTMLRILPLWLMVYLAVLNVLFAVRLWKEKTPLTRIAALTLIFWYVALNLPDWGRIMAQYNGAL